jgi:hypothetical protein
MQNVPDSALTQAVREASHPLTGANTDYDALMDFIGDARVVLFRAYGLYTLYQSPRDSGKPLFP